MEWREVSGRDGQPSIQSTGHGELIPPAAWKCVLPTPPLSKHTALPGASRKKGSHQRLRLSPRPAPQISSLETIRGQVCAPHATARWSLAAQSQKMNTDP